MGELSPSREFSNLTLDAQEPTIESHAYSFAEIQRIHVGENL